MIHVPQQISQPPRQPPGFGLHNSMSEIKIVLPDNSVKEFDHRPTVLEVAQSIGEGLAKNTVGGQINGSKEIIDLRTPLDDGTQLSIVTQNSEEGLEVIRHSAAHVMAQAVQEIWPDIQVTIGPVIDNGFYYDFHSDKPFHEDDLKVIEKKIACTKWILLRNVT